MKITTLVPPAASAVSLEQARAFLRVDYGGEDDLLADLIASAEARIEKACSIRLMPQTLRLDMECWPRNASSHGKFALTVRPVRSVVSVVANDVDVSGDFRLLAESWPTLAPIGVWPPGDEGVSITIEAGFASAGDIPADLTLAVRMLAADGYRRREGDPDDGLSEDVSRLIAPWRRAMV